MRINASKMSTRLIKNVIPFSVQKRHIAKQRTLNKFPKLHVYIHQKRKTSKNWNTKTPKKLRENPNPKHDVNQRDLQIKGFELQKAVPDYC